MYKLYKYISLKVTNIYYVKLLIIHLKKNLISYIQNKNANTSLNTLFGRYCIIYLYTNTHTFIS